MFSRIIMWGAFLWGATAFAQSPIIVSASAWAALNQDEKDAIQSKHIVQAVGVESFGVIFDNQGIDQSTPGSSVGSNLGQSFGSATYIDRALSNGNYSARDHLGAMIVGALIGSAFNSQKVEKYQFRYAVRLGSGNVGYYDIISDTPFRHPSGICVLVPQVVVATDQSVCGQTAEVLRRNYLGSIGKKSETVVNLPAKELLDVVRNSSSEKTNAIENVESRVEDVVISCRVGVLPPVKTSSEKCLLINGVVEK